MQKKALKRAKVPKNPHAFSNFIMYPEWDLNPHEHYCPLDFKSSASTNSAIRANLCFILLRSILLRKCLSRLFKDGGIGHPCSLAHH